MTPSRPARTPGRHFLQLPGPSNLPDRVLRAMARPLIDHRGPDFAKMSKGIQAGLRRVFATAEPVIVFPSSASGAWEAALVNTLAPGDRVLAFDRGFFAAKWARMAEALGFEVELMGGDWSHPVDPGDIERRLREDGDGSIRAVLLVHNETSTGVRSDVYHVRDAIDRAGHDALLMVDAVSSLASMEYRHDGWGVDVTVAGSQKGLMLPPGLGFTAISRKARAAAGRAGSGEGGGEGGGSRRSYFDWGDMLDKAEDGFFPYTPATSLLFGLEESLAMLGEEGLERVFARHRRHGEATREAVAAWGLETVCRDPGAHSDTVTSVALPDGHDADAFRKVVRERFDMSLGKGLGRLEGRAFRIGHLGDLNDLTLAGALAGVEMGLAAAGVPHDKGGVQAAMDLLAGGGS